MFIKIYIVAFISFFAIDLVWLGLIANNLYKKYLGYIMAPSVNWYAAILFYLLYIGGISFFVISVAIDKRSLQYAIFAGMFFGFITYATYDLTNLATLDKWPVLITVIDLIWGTILGGMVSTVSYLIINKFFQ